MSTHIALLYNKQIDRDRKANRIAHPNDREWVPFRACANRFAFASACRIFPMRRDSEFPRMGREKTETRQPRFSERATATPALIFGGFSVTVRP